MPKTNKSQQSKPKTTKSTKASHTNKSQKKEEDIFDFDKVEKKIDFKIDQLSENKIVDKIVNKFLKIDLVDKILKSKVVNDTNKKLAPHLANTFKVLARLGIIGWGIGLLMALSFLFWPLWAWAFGWFIRSLLYLTIILGGSVLAIVQWLGFLRYKKWTMFVVLLNLWLSIISLITSLIPTGYFYGNAIRTWFGNAILSILVTGIIVILVFKNKKIFNK